MPEVELTIRWPDGTVQHGISPSRAIEQLVVEGGRYPSEELRRRLRDGLEAASERVRERFGFACTGAAQQLDEFENGAARHGASGPGAGEPVPGGPGAGPPGRRGAPIAVVERVRRVAAAPRFPAPEQIGGHRGVVVIGGGQAGLAVSWHLREQGIDHLVLERDRVACTWRDQRWDSFCLVTPNWQCRLPGHPYPGTDRDGFMLRDDIIDYVESYASSFDPPLYEGVKVQRVTQGWEAGFRVSTSHGELTAEQVVLAVGGYHLPGIPRIAERLPESVTQLHSSGYRNPSSLPDGGVMVVGSGQSGAQIAEDLLLAGRDVHLSVGSAPRVARFYRGRDCVAWLHDMGHYDMPVTEHPEGLGARREPNHYVTGRGGGRDIDLRAHAREGMKLHGRLLSAHGPRLEFAEDLAKNLDAADATAERIKDAIDGWIERQGIEAPTEERYKPVWQPGSGSGSGSSSGSGSGEAARALDLEAAGIRSVIWATGFHSDWSWVDVPAFDGRGYPANLRGVTSVPGLYVIGLPWLHTWGSGRFAGVARDAAFLAQRIAEHASDQALAA
jgi:putative flavoprotein involved in K+ transport